MANKVVREKVIAFRVSPEQYKEIQDRVNEAGIVDVVSPGLMGRKLMLDWLINGIKWTDKKLQRESTDVYLSRKQAKTKSTTAPVLA